MEIFLDNMSAVFLHRTIQIISNNRRERKNTYNVIGIMKGEIEPGKIPLCQCIEEE